MLERMARVNYLNYNAIICVIPAIFSLSLLKLITIYLDCSPNYILKLSD